MRKGLLLLAACLILCACAQTTQPHNDNSSDFPMDTVVSGSTLEHSSIAPESLQPSSSTSPKQMRLTIPEFSGQEIMLTSDNFVLNKDAQIYNDFLKHTSLEFNQQIVEFTVSPNGKNYAYYLFTCAVDEKTGKPYFWSGYYQDEYPPFPQVDLVACIDGIETMLYSKKEVPDDETFRHGIDWVNDQTILEDYYIFYNLTTLEKIEINTPAGYINTENRTNKKIFFVDTDSVAKERDGLVPYALRNGNQIYICIYDINQKTWTYEAEPIITNRLSDFSKCIVSWSENGNLLIVYRDQPNLNENKYYVIIAEIDLKNKTTKTIFTSEGYFYMMLEPVFLNDRCAVFQDDEYVYILDLHKMQWLFYTKGYFHPRLYRGAPNRIAVSDVEFTDDGWVVDRYVYDLEKNIRYSLMFEESKMVDDSDYEIVLD